MAIQWFPGHMHKTRKGITERLKHIDVVVQMLDARLPASSANPMLARLAKGKPRLMILNKQDLADPAMTALWLTWYSQQKQTQALGLDASERRPAQKLIQACRQLAPSRVGLEKPLRIMICGIPNVGKSTLINSLHMRKIAKTGNMPGITRQEQRIILADDVELFDTPGMLWPKIEVEESGYNLAASGAIGRNAMNEEEVALVLLGYLQKHYLSLLENRYKAVGEWELLSDWQLLENIARKRGAVLPGGRFDLQKTSELVLQEFQSGLIGRITLERPEEWQCWVAKAKEESAIRAQGKMAKEQDRKKRTSG